MESFKQSIIMRTFTVIHYVVMVLSFLVIWLQFYRVPFTHGEYFVHNRTIFAIYVVGLFVLMRLYNAYEYGLLRTAELVYSQVLADLLTIGMVYVATCIMAQRLVNPLALIGLFAVQAVFCILWMLLANKVYFMIHKPKTAVAVYGTATDLKKIEEVKYFDHRWNLLEKIQWNENRGNRTGNPEEASVGSEDIHVLMPMMEPYETVFVSGITATLRNGIEKYCIEMGKDCYFVPHIGDVITAGAQHMHSFAVPIYGVHRCRLTPEYRFIKRAMDILISGIATVILSPFILVTAIAIKAYDGGPALYRQVRLTKDGRKFEILKFRSMKIDAEKDGVARLASENDDRITPVGKVIRAIRFDELPQLVNILRGDMSIVGPRPERPEIAAQYEKQLPAFKLRLQVKAGLTGYAQVYGRYNTEPSDKLKMDLMYINNIGLVEDMKLMFATVKILFMKESTAGISDDQVTALSDRNEE